MPNTYPAAATPANASPRNNPRPPTESVMPCSLRYFNESSSRLIAARAGAARELEGKCESSPPLRGGLQCTAAERRTTLFALELVRGAGGLVDGRGAVERLVL